MVNAPGPGENNDEVRPSRRQMLGAMGAGATVAWAAPQIVSVTAASAASVAPITFPVTAIDGYSGSFVVSTSDGRAFITRDSGATWAELGTTVPTGTDLMAVSVDHQGDAAVIAANGSAWHVTYTTMGAGLVAATTSPVVGGPLFATGRTNKLVVVDGTGHVNRSNDRGITWVPTVTLTGASIIGIASINANGYLLLDADGSPWSLANLSISNGQQAAPVDTPVLTAIAGSSAPSGSLSSAGAINGTGDVFTTSGGSWTTSATGAQTHGGLVSIAGDGSGEYIVVAADGAIYRSSTGGTVWTGPLSTPPIVMTKLAGDLAGHVVGYDQFGQFAYSTDFGTSWSVPTTPPA